MIYRFDCFELDVNTVELRRDGASCPVEPQVFALLALLLENRERMVSKDEIIEKVWDGRAISDSAVASRVKAARRAIGDDGRNQRLIRTIHGRGFRFVASVKAVHGAELFQAVTRRGPADPPHGESTPTAGVAASKPSIAVLPLRVVGTANPYAAFAAALPHDLILDLSRLRWLHVTARGSSFRLSTSDTDMSDIGRLLGVQYCLSGSLEVAGARLHVTVELVDTRDGGVVWADHYASPVGDVHRIRSDIRGQILAALEIRIPLHEAELARMQVSESLDAWSTYHLGLQHMYRFNRADNAAATVLFKKAVSLDPGFARAHAGLSFVHFQTAFLGQTDDLALEIGLARRFAERGVELDPLDPFVNFTMGRTYWLDGDLERGLAWLERATTISPNYAQGIYARGWTEALAGRELEAREHVDLAMRLSPLDPLHYAMQGTRAFTHIALREDAQAAYWAERAARSPGAHVLIAMIAAASHALAGDIARAETWAANVRERNQKLTRENFFRAFPMKVEAVRLRVSNALERCGF